ncbi:MAG: hypothetical protein HZB51_03895 [Chloroflexi bacterium]|nr:hypothetical protein [Chloroflexota bacterium]
MHKLLEFLNQLEQAKIDYRLAHIRDSILVALVIPGERWEVEFFEDGHVEFERFVSDGRIEDESTLNRLIKNQLAIDEGT